MSDKAELPEFSPTNSSESNDEATEQNPAAIRYKACLPSYQFL